MKNLFAVAAVLVGLAASADTLVTNTSGSNYTLPPVYGSITLSNKAGPNHAAIIADTKALVQAALGAAAGTFSYSTVPSGQAGAIVPVILPNWFSQPVATPSMYSGVVVTDGGTRMCVSTPAFSDGAYLLKGKASGIGPTGDGGYGAEAFEITGGFIVDAGVPSQIGSTSAGIAVHGSFLSGGGIAFAVDGGAVIVQSTSVTTGAFVETVDWECLLSIDTAAH